MYSAFQSNAFQNNAFQIGSGQGIPDVTGGGFIYQTASQIYKAEQYALKLKRQELQSIEKELALKQQEQEAVKLQVRNDKRRKLAVDKAAAIEAQIDAGLQERINVLRMERVRLMRQIDDEEAVLVILMALPAFH